MARSSPRARRSSRRRRAFAHQANRRDGGALARRHRHQGGDGGQSAKAKHAQKQLDEHHAVKEGASTWQAHAQFSSRLGRGDSTHHGIPPPLAAALNALKSMEIRRAEEDKVGQRLMSWATKGGGPVPKSSVAASPKRSANYARIQRVPAPRGGRLKDVRRLSEKSYARPSRIKRCRRWSHPSWCTSTPSNRRWIKS